MDFVRDDAVQERLETLCFRYFHDNLCGRDETGASENSHLLELGTEVDDFLIVEHSEALYHYWMEGEAHERLVHDLGDGEIARALGAHELGQKAGRPAAHPQTPPEPTGRTISIFCEMSDINILLIKESECVEMFRLLSPSRGAFGKNRLIF